MHGDISTRLTRELAFKVRVSFRIFVKGGGGGGGKCDNSRVKGGGGRQRL